MAQELILCVRAISNYQVLWSADGGDTGPRPGAGSGSSAYVAGTTLLRMDGVARAAVAPGADDMAWSIYASFVRAGAPYEVSVSHRRRKIIAQQLAAPEPDMFDRLQVRRGGPGVGGVWPRLPFSPLPIDALLLLLPPKRKRTCRSKRTWRWGSTLISSTRPSTSRRYVAWHLL